MGERPASRARLLTNANAKGKISAKQSFAKNLNEHFRFTRRPVAMITDDNGGMVFVTKRGFMLSFY